MHSGNGSASATAQVMATYGVGLEDDRIRCRGDGGESHGMPSRWIGVSRESGDRAPHFLKKQDVTGLQVQRGVHQGHRRAAALQTALLVSERVEMDLIVSR